MNKVWLVTGCSTGFGRSLSCYVLSCGHRVAVTARKMDDITDIISAYPDTALGVTLDVTRQEEVVAAVQKTVQRFGRIDVLVNNAGIGYFAAVEESEESELRRMFEINFFGLAIVTQKVLPVMRTQKSGHILNISSIGGLRGFPGLGFYNASKFAVEGLSEALSKEVAPLGIRVTLIEPSGFRTDWAGRSAKDSPVRIADYATTAGQNSATIRGYSGQQAGDPERAAKAIFQIVESGKPPLRLLLGSAALRGARIKLEELQQDFDAWADLTCSADFPKEPPL